MRTATITVLLVWLSMQANSQAIVLEPGQYYRNGTGDTLVVVTKSRLQRQMEREMLLEETISLQEEKQALRDSMLHIKSREAEGWYAKLMETDMELEACTKEMHIQKSRQRKSRRIIAIAAFFTGALTGLLF